MNTSNNAKTPISCYALVMCGTPILVEGAINRVLRSTSILNPYKFYPKILSDNQGTDIRLILKADHIKS